MADLPTVRSFSKTLGDLIDAFLSRYGIKSLRIASPILAILEAAAQSDVRSSQDVFELLKSIALDQARGTALLRLGADEGLTKISDSASSGIVTVSDTSFTKKSTSIFQGLAAPIVGSQTIYVKDAATWDSTGSLYLGRGTTNYEGPIPYDVITSFGSYYSIHLTTGTNRFHNWSESVIQAQGGNRQILAGNLIQTPQGNTADSVQFSTLYSATILDGEVEIDNVEVVAQTLGIVGNVQADSITEFVNDPFTGAAVSNPLPFSNGLAEEDDDTFRERIREVRQARTLGTPLALKLAAVGITSSDENKRVVSSSIIVRKNYPTTLYIDDGTGYEERSTGIAIESIVDLASGGEQYFQLASDGPVTKAFVETTITEPFALTSGMVLAVKVAGKLYEHTFSDGEFRSISNATAYEVEASINADPDATFSARIANSGIGVAIFAKSDSNEDIEVVAPSDPTNDANTVLGFPAGRVDTMRLYRDDRLLFKDGRVARITATPQASWGAIVSTDTLVLTVDGTPTQTITVVDQDFIDAETGFTTVSRANSIDAWAAVFNAKVAGITAANESQTLTLVSNLGSNDRSAITISGGTLVSNAKMFSSDVGFGLTVSGRSNDYELDRNTKQITLSKALAVDSRLSAGTVNTRAFIESDALAPITISGGETANFWFVVDGAAEIINTGINGSTPVSMAETGPTQSWGKRVTVSFSSSVLTNVEDGDWAIFWDANLDSANLGAWRVVNVTDTSFDIERSSFTVEASVSLASGGITIVRTTAIPQLVTVSSGTNYTANSLVTLINAQLNGATASTYRTSKVRVTTNTFEAEGDIALVVADTIAQAFSLPVSDAVTNLSSHLPAIEAGNKESGTPEFLYAFVDTPTSNNALTSDDNTGFTVDKMINFLRNQPDVNGPRWGTNVKHYSPIADFTAGVFTLRNGVLNEILPEDRIYPSASLALGPQDTITVELDQDVQGKTFSIPAYRRLQPSGSSYGGTNSFLDLDNNSYILTNAFGKDFDFDDFAVYMRARTESSPLDSTKTILWRYYRFGPEGNNTELRYVYPTAPSQAIAVTADPDPSSKVRIAVRLPSSTRKSVPNVRTSTRLGFYQYGAGPYTLGILLGYAIASASRTSNVTTLTLTLNTSQTNHGLQAGDQVYIVSSDVNFTGGLKTLTSVTATDILYNETASDNTGGAIGTVSFDRAEANWSGASIVVGDIVTIGSTATVPTGSKVTMRISAVTQYALLGKVETTTSNTTTAAWSFLSDLNALQVYSLGSRTLTAIVTAVNALSNSPVTATAIGSPTSTTIDKATFEEENTVGAYYTLVDGVNYIETTNNPPDLVTNYSLSFKTSVDSGLAGTGSDWANEELRLTPITTKGVVDLLNSSAVGGLFDSALVQSSDQGTKVQIASDTAGSAGAVQAQGGTANSTSATVIGYGSSTVSNYLLTQIPVADAEGLFGGIWCSLQNTNVMPKDVVDNATIINSIDASGWVTFAAPVWAYTNGGTITTHTWQVEKQGDYTSLVWDGVGAAPNVTAPEGSWVTIKYDGTPGALSSLNTGTFRVVRSDIFRYAFWIENPNSIEELGTCSSIRMFTFDSALPGDTVVISTGLLGATNKGTWTIAEIDDTDDTIFRITRGSVLPTVVGSPVGLGSQFNLFQVLEGSPSRLTKKIQCISPNTDSDYADLLFTTDEGYAQVSELAGTIIQPLDKLDFTTKLVTGIDGYRYSIGLIGEVNRVLYGDERDSATYPGVVAAGANVNISGPITKRIQVSLVLRLDSGIPVKDVYAAVRSAVAQVINSTKQGQSIAIVDILDAARGVSGVKSVAIASPTYSPGSDLISVQPFEKPKVLDLEQDIQLSTAG